MKKILLAMIPLLLLGFIILPNLLFGFFTSGTGAPPYSIEDLEPPEEDRYAWIDEWKRPESPPKVGLQAGHWKNNELPEELHRLDGSTGSSGNGKTEWEVNLAIVQATKTILEKKGINVDILPATIPIKYWADVFVSIHADGSTDISKSGFKGAAPRRDFSGKASKLLSMIVEDYEKATQLSKDPNITHNMRGYYAFAWWRYDHAVHPRTPSVILETGFLTNPLDRKLIVNKPEVAAQGLANGIIKFFESENLINYEEN